uniref:Uncharacterized protein n=1 Tax=Hyaloperonospora arabidopsidis (strain Emoy2) TaxID=559515 RepID=M4BTW2_HYAAE
MYHILKLATHAAEGGVLAKALLKDLTRPWMYRSKSLVDMEKMLRAIEPKLPDENIAPILGKYMKKKRDPNYIAFVGKV